MARAQSRVAAVSKQLTETPARVARPTVADFKYFLPIQTRWSDSDNYNHVNNVVYLHYLDSVCNQFLIRQCGMDPANTIGQPIGLCVASTMSYAAPLTFPNVVVAALACRALGNSSVTWSCAVFETKDEQCSYTLQNGAITSSVKPLEQAAAFGEFKHVFVDPKSRRPVPIPQEYKNKIREML